LIFDKVPITDYSLVTAPMQVKINGCDKAFIVFDGHIYQISKESLQVLGCSEDQNLKWISSHDSEKALKFKLTKDESSKYLLEEVLPEDSDGPKRKLCPQKDGEFKLVTPSWPNYLNRTIFPPAFEIEAAFGFNKDELEILQKALFSNVRATASSD